MSTVTKEPRYQEITNRFRERVRSGALSPGARLPSFAEMKEQYGASQATMDRVFALLEQDGLIVREQGRGTFVADPSRRPKSGLIGFVGNDYAVRQRIVYSAHILEGIEEVIAREEKRLLLLRNDSPVGWDQVEGVLLHDPRGKIESLSTGLPCVAVVEAVAGIASVVADDYDGGRQAARHLLQLGHRSIAYLLQKEEVPWLRRRAAGFRDALEEAGITVPVAWIRDPQTLYPSGGYPQWGFDSVQNWLEDDWKQHKFTALIAQNDLAAIGAIEALRQAGLRVPQDVSVMGYDGTEVCEHCSPHLTAIEVPLHDISVKATEMLFLQISGEKSGQESVVLPIRIKEGGTTAPVGNMGV
jgi:DNA-binding LacI/PurR family transcriptional regulator